jgi:hypothetical protein
LDELQEVRGFGHNAAMIFQSQHDAPFAGVVAAFLERIQAQPFGLLRRQVAGSAGEHAQMRRAHHGRAIDPAFDTGDFPVAVSSGGKGEAVSHRGSRDVDSAQEGVSFQLQQVGVIRVRRKIVARQFGADAAVLGAKINELEQVDLLRGLGWPVPFVAGVDEVIAE